MFRTVFLSIIRSSKLRIQQRYMPNSCCYLLASSSCLTYACCCMCSLELLMMDGKTSETWRVFYENKQFEKHVHVVGFTIGIYYDARTYERQKYHEILTAAYKKHMSKCIWRLNATATEARHWTLLWITSNHNPHSHQKLPKITRNIIQPLPP